MSKQIDDKILAELRQDARLPITVLAQQVGRSRTAVQARVDKMLQDQRILRFTIDEPGFTRDSDVGAVIQISVKVRNKSQELLARLRSMPQVIGCYGVAGSFDFMLILSRMDHQELKRWLEDIYSMDAVSKTETILSLYREF